MNALAHPDLVAARKKAGEALGNRDMLAHSEAMFDHRNLVRELAPEIHLQWYRCMELHLAKAFEKQVQS